MKSSGPKYNYVAHELGEGAKTEDILKVMEAIGGIALKLKLEDKLSGPFGFNKKKKMKKTEPLILDNAYFLDSLGSILQVVVMNCIQPANWKYCYRVDQWLIPDLVHAWKIKTGDIVPYQEQNEYLKKYKYD